jgi:hypothetical protein
MKKNRNTFLKNLINIPPFFEGYRRGKVIPYTLIYVTIYIRRREDPEESPQL